VQDGVLDLGRAWRTCSSRCKCSCAHTPAAAVTLFRVRFLPLKAIQYFYVKKLRSPTTAKDRSILSNERFRSPFPFHWREKSS